MEPWFWLGCFEALLIRGESSEKGWVHSCRGGLQLYWEDRGYGICLVYSEILTITEELCSRGKMYSWNPKVSFEIWRYYIPQKIFRNLKKKIHNCVCKRSSIVPPQLSFNHQWLDKIVYPSTRLTKLPSTEPTQGIVHFHFMYKLNADGGGELMTWIKLNW